MFSFSFFFKVNWKSVFVLFNVVNNSFLFSMIMSVYNYQVNMSKYFILLNQISKGCDNVAGVIVENIIAFQEIVNFSNTIFFRQHKWMTKLFFNTTTMKVFICSIEYGLLLVLQDSWSLGLFVLETKWRSGMLSWQRVLRDVWRIVFRVTV